MFRDVTYGDVSYLYPFFLYIPFPVETSVHIFELYRGREKEDILTYIRIQLQRQPSPHDFTVVTDPPEGAKIVRCNKVCSPVWCQSVHPPLGPVPNRVQCVMDPQLDPLSSSFQVD